METSKIGSLEVSAIGIGCNNFGRALDEAGSKAVVDAALDCGINFFDTAANYGSGQSEGFLGAALRGRRELAVIATKFGVPRPDEDHGGAAPAYVRRSVEKSFDALGTDTIDLLQLHKPDPEVPIADTLSAMWDLVDDGTVREIGCSNLDAAQLREALDCADAAGRPRFVSNQVEYSLIHRDPEHNGLVSLCADEGVALLPFYPLANGLLTGKTRRGETPQGRLTMDRYQKYLTDENFDIAESVVAFAAERGVEPVEVALRWLLSRRAVPAVTPGATKPEQVMSNARAGASSLDAGEFAELDRRLETA